MLTSCLLCFSPSILCCCVPAAEDIWQHAAGCYDNNREGRRMMCVCVCVCSSVWVCEHKSPCVGQKHCKVIPCITRTPARLHNRPNRGTLTAFFLQVCWCPSFLYFSFPSFHQTPATLTFWLPFRRVMSAWKTLKCFAWHHFLLRISQASNVACELRTATGSSWNEHTSGTQPGYRWD